GCFHAGTAFTYSARRRGCTGDNRSENQDEGQLPIENRGLSPVSRVPRIQALDLHQALFPESVRTIAVPGPQFGFGHQSLFYRISVHVSKFLCELRPGEHIEVIEPGLPEMALVGCTFTGNFVLLSPPSIRE